MCLAIPGKILTAYEHHGLPMAKVQFGAITREACLTYTPEARVGDYVLVHVGFAISCVNEAEAARTYSALAELNQLGELDAPVVADSAAPGRGERGPQPGASISGSRGAAALGPAPNNAELNQLGELDAPVVTDH